MFKFIEKLEEVKDFDFYQNQLFLLSKSGKIQPIDNLDFHKSVTDLKYPGEIFIYNKYLIWQDMFGKSLIYDIEKSKLIYDNFSCKDITTFRRIDLIPQNTLIANRRIDGKKMICYFNIVDKDFKLISFDISKSCGRGKYLFKFSKDFLRIESILFDGKVIWDYTLSRNFLDNRQEIRLASFNNVLGIYGNVVWLSLNSGELIGFDVNLGILISIIGFKETNFAKIPWEVNEGDYIPFGDLTQLDESKGEIFALRDKYFLKVNLNDSNLRGEYVDVSASMDVNNITSSFRNTSFPYDDKYIYFCDDMQGRIGVFDREKEEVIWSYELEMKREGIAQILEMKYNDNKLYVLDRNETLHIFEKEL